MKIHKIEVDDDVFLYLKNYAEPFVDTPNTVLRKILGIERQNKNKEITIQKIKRNKTNTIRKSRNLELEHKIKHSVGEALKIKWGNFRIVGQSTIDFNQAKVQVLCKYSRCTTENGRWFWGVQKKKWEKMPDNHYIALAYENNNRDGYSFVLLDSNAIAEIFPHLSESDGHTKINMSFYVNDTRPHLDELQDFPIYKYVHELQLLDFNNK